MWYLTVRSVREERHFRLCIEIISRNIWIVNNGWMVPSIRNRAENVEWLASFATRSKFSAVRAVFGLPLSGVARIWCEEEHETQRKINNLRVTHKNIMKFMQ